MVLQKKCCTWQKTWLTEIRPNTTLKRSSENLDITLQNLSTKKVKFSDEKRTRTKVAEAVSKIIKDARENNTLGNYVTSTDLSSIAYIHLKKI